MPRKATSPAEIEQIVRVRTLLRSFRLVPSADLHVMTTARKTCSGRLVRDHVGSSPTKRGDRAYYGAIVLHTKAGEVEIDYLDVVWVDVDQPPEAIAPPSADTEPPCEAQDSSGMLSS